MPPGELSRRRTDEVQLHQLLVDAVEGLKDFEYATNELLHIFDGVRMLRYEDTAGSYDWGSEKIRLVRLVAQRPR